MSLLNEALRKKGRELGQIKKVNLFRDKPKPRNRGMRRFSVLVIFIVLSSGLAFWESGTDFYAQTLPLRNCNW